ncbi:DUF4913 domain-containing protein [Nocardia blacklockiae]|uniref:DUF4913 domain-containing protein n=1 Tax=Nocardia blacklockiae TaxID=480036 RepID=UPI002B4ABCBE|nr:DUF4913 domain-containing protein [Nocardia blacklockiae]
MDAQEHDTEPGPIYESVGEFVENYLSLVYRRNVTGGQRVWCPRWWMHAEAVLRLEAVWRAWEYLRLDSKTGMSTWLLDHADPHMAVLFDRHGPFEYCSVEKGHADTMKPLSLVAIPPNVFSPDTASDA